MVVCFLILVAGRVINVYVPIYYKNIVNALTPGVNYTSQLDNALADRLGVSDAGTKIVFPIASICIYVALKFMQVRTSVCMFINHR